MQIILQILFSSNGSFPAICFECSLNWWHPQKTKGASSLNGSDSGFNIYYITGSKWSSPRQFNINLGLGSKYDPNSTLYPLLAKFLIPKFLGTDCFAGNIPALLVTSLLSKSFVQKRSQLKISGMDPGQTCLFFGRTWIFGGVSSCVERIFTYYNKVMSANRASLKSETIKQLMFLYCNRDLSWIHFLSW